MKEVRREKQGGQLYRLSPSIERVNRLLQTNGDILTEADLMFLAADIKYDENLKKYVEIPPKVVQRMKEFGVDGYIQRRFGRGIWDDAR